MGKWCLGANIQRYCSRKLYPGVNIQCCCPPSLVSIWLTSVPKNQTFCFPFAQRHVQTRSQTRSQKIHGILLETVRPTGARICNFIWFFPIECCIRHFAIYTRNVKGKCPKLYQSVPEIHEKCMSKSITFGMWPPEPRKRRP